MHNHKTPQIGVHGYVTTRYLKESRSQDISRNPEAEEIMIHSKGKVTNKDAVE